MATVRPFRAIRYSPVAGPLPDLVAPPYDVIPEEERQRLAVQNAANVIHLILPRGEEPYRAAADKLASLLGSGALVRDPEPGLLLTSQRFAANGTTAERWGLLAAVRLEPLDGGVILPHERTLAAPKADRLKLIRACRTNLSPIFGLVDAPLDLASLAPGGTPVDAWTDRAGVQHRLWRLTDPATLAALAEKLGPQQVFIADGHHRYETSLAYRDERRASDGRTGAPGEALRAYDFILFYLCSTRDPGLVVLPTHRILPAADAPAITGLLDRWASACEVHECAGAAELESRLAAPEPGPRRSRIGLLHRGSGRSWLLEASPATGPLLAGKPAELRALDVTFLHDVILPGIAADRYRYTHDGAEALQALATGEAEIVALLPPPLVDDVLAISRASLTMPQKSTYFHPKVLSGLAFHSLED